jgi:hypothetical protein
VTVRKRNAEKEKQVESLLRVGEQDEVDERASWRFEGIMEEDRKRKERLKAEMMAEARKIGTRYLRWKILREGKRDQVLPQSHPACACTDRIQEMEWIFEKLMMMNSKVRELTVKVEKTEKELKCVRNE